MLPIYKMILTEETEGMDFIALVDSPAHMKSFEYFNGETEKVKYHFNEEKRVVTGVAIAVDLPIYRRDEQLGEHYVVFGKEDTYSIAQKMFKGGYLNNVNEMHDSNKKVEDMYLFESYFVDSKRGVKAPSKFDSQNLKDGSWIVSYKVDNAKAWNDIKKGKHVGFSIEGWFDKKIIKTKQTQMKKESKSLFEMVFGKAKFETATTVDGVEISWTGALEEGTELRIKTEEGEVLAPEGIHSIEVEGVVMTITVDGNGIIVSVEEETAGAPEDAPIEEVMNEIAKVIAKVQSEFKAEIEGLKTINSKFEKQIETLVTELDKTDKRKFNTNTPEKTWRNFTK
jgi:hypothetical protein